MKLSLRSFKSALNNVRAATKLRTSLQALKGVRLTCTDDDKLTLEATNGEAWVSCKIERGGGMQPVLVDHDRLIQIVGLATDESIELLLNEAGTRLTLKCGKSVNLVSTYDVNEFLPDPTFTATDAKLLAVNAQDLGKGIESVAWCAEKDQKAEMKYLNLIIELKSQSLTCVGFRGNMMAHFNCAAICEEKSFSLPATWVSVLTPAMAEKDAQIVMTPRMISVRHANGSATAKLSEFLPVPYGDIMKMRSKDMKASLIDREFLKRACAYACMFADLQASAFVRIYRKDDGVSVSVVGQHGEHEEDCDAFIQQTDFDFALSANYLNEAMSVSAADEVGVLMAESPVFFEFGNLTVVIARIRPKAKAGEAK
jgi:DNA polymerase III sliding clamp (beta) subunit (PCNA family)